MARRPKHLPKGTKRISKLERKEGFQKNTPGGYPVKNGGTVPWLNQIHHILPCTLFKYANIKKTVGGNTEQATYIWDCLWITDYDINLGHNLIRLPLKGTYTGIYRSGARKLASATYVQKQRALRKLKPCNLPCHDYGHSGNKGYIGEVRDRLKMNVWNALSVTRKAHNTDAKKIKRLLKAEEDHFRERLKNRPRERGGTVNGWLNMRPPSPGWYAAFSMAKNPTRITSL